MMDVSWLGEAMEKAGYRFNKDLAEAADVSGATVGNALKKGRVRESTAQKLQAACGEFPIGPLVDVNRIGPREEPRSEPVDDSLEICLERFEGKDCPTSSATCVACFDKLRENLPDKELPMNRAMCRLSHGWVHRKGSILYRDEQGNELESHELTQ